MTYRRLLLCLVVLAASVAWAEPGPMPIGPRSPVLGAQADWDMVHQSAKAVARALKLRFGQMVGAHETPLTQDEEQCLLNRTTQDQLRTLGAFMSERGDKAAQAILARLLSAITPGGAGTDWCSRAGHLGENRGLSIYKAGTPARSEARLMDRLREWAEGLRGRPPTPAEVAAALMAAALAAPVLAPL